MPSIHETADPGLKSPLSEKDLAETHEALGHRHAVTTRVYVQRIARKRDKFSRHILGTLELPEIDGDSLTDLL